MVILVKAEVLAVGIGGMCRYFENLPVRLCSLETGREAASSLKYKNYDAVVGRWNLADMADGKFLRGLKLARPGILTAAVVDSENFDEEIQARSCGVNAVFTENTSEYVFSETIAELLKAGVSARYPLNSIK